MPSRVLVLNPNSDDSLTISLESQLTTIFPHNTLAVEQLDAAPRGIATYKDIHIVEKLLLERFSRAPDRTEAIVIACFADPGVKLLQEQMEVPVLGIATTGLFSALSLARPLGVLSAGTAVIPRHWEFYQRLGIAHLIADDQATSLPPGEAHPGEIIRQQLQAVATSLIETGAHCLVLGCAAFASHRTWLEAEVGVPVVDPVCTTTAQALLLAGQQGTK